MSRILTHGAVCVDCALIIANDDDSGMEDGPAHREQMRAHAVVAIEGDANWVICGDADDFFSWRPCDTCGSDLGGDRVPAVLLSN